MAKSVRSNGRKRPHRKPRISGTREWAVKNINCCDGCSHGCVYCYAAWTAIVRGKRSTREQWPLEKVRDHDVQKGRGRHKGRVMFPSLHDITPGNIDACEIVLLKLLKAGNEVLIVSKPHLACITRLVESLAAYKDKVLFRFTIGVMDEELRAFWEPGAPGFKERLACLRLAFDAGFQTSVSAEPLLEPWNVARLVKSVRPYVTNSIWIGKMNQSGTRTKWAVRPDDPRLVKLESWQTDDKVRAIYEMFRNDPLVRWKESYKKVIGLPEATESGLDK